MNCHRFSVLFALLACLALPAAAEIEIHDAWVRAMPPGSPGTAGYLRVVNAGDTAVVITGASSGIAGRTEIHETVERDGMLRMAPLPRLELASGAQAMLEPGGRHLMLMDLASMPGEGDTVQVCLQLAAGGERCADAEVKRGNGGGHHHH